MSSPPVGLSIGGSSPRKPQWKIGKRIGSGACASVHLLNTPEGKDSGWVVKCVPLPTKITKKKATIPERNARLLDYEYQVYQNQFPDYQGYILPKFPPYIGPPVSGDVNGFRFLVIEKMKSPLWDVIPALLKSNSSTIDLAPIVTQLLVCVESFHDENHLLVDIKPENFMLAYKDHGRKVAKSKGKASKSTEIALDLARKLRVLDLGLVVPWKGPQGHRPDEGINEIVGTPLYASLHVHAQHTPSRRDDIESLGYVVAEMIIRLVAEANGETSNYKGANDKEIPTYLPWSRAKSDDAIGALKTREVNNIRSDFYKRMGDKETAKAMKSLFDLTQSMKYKEKPDYDEIHSILETLQVTVEPTKKRARTSPGRPTRASRSTRSKRANSHAEGSDDEKNPSPKKQQKTKAEEADEEDFVDAAMEVDSDHDVVVIDDDNDNEVFEDAKEEAHKEEEEKEEAFVDAEEAEEMDWEPAKENRTKPGNALGVIVALEEGSIHAGDYFELKQGEIETVVIGQNPKVDKPVQGQGFWPLNGEEGVEDNHARLDLKVSRRLCSVNLTDLATEEETLVGSKPVAGSTRVFINDKFSIGNSVFRIKELPKAEEGGGAPAPKKAKAAAKSTTRSKASKKPLAQKNVADPRPPAAVKGKPGADVVLLKIVSGPHKGKSYALSKEGVNTINFGSEKSVAKKGQPIVLASDKGIEPRHARFVLVASKKLTKVAVVDLSEAGTFINGKKTQKNKEHMAFVGDRCKMGDTTIEIKLGD